MDTPGHYEEVIAKLDGLHELMVSKFEENQSCHESLIKRMDIANGRTSKNEDRLGVLENWRWYLVGIFSIMIFIADYIFRK